MTDYDPTIEDSYTKQCVIDDTVAKLDSKLKNDSNFKSNDLEDEHNSLKNSSRNFTKDYSYSDNPLIKYEISLFVSKLKKTLPILRHTHNQSILNGIFTKI